MHLRQQRRQADGSRAFHRPQVQHPARRFVVHGAARFLGQRQQPVRIIEQHPAPRGQLHALALADEQGHAQILFQLPDPCGDVRRHAVQHGGGARDAAGNGYRLEYAQIGQIHILK